MIKNRFHRPIALALMVSALSFWACKSTKVDDSTTIERGTYQKAVVQNGEVKDVFQGKVIAKGQYQDSLKTGKWVFSSEVPPVSITAHFNEGKLHGLYTYQNPKMRYEGRYEQGVKVDTHRSYYPNGELCKEMIYRNGRKVNTEKWYYNSGRSWKTLPYNAKGQLDGLVVEMYENQRPARNIQYENGKRNGYETRFYENGYIMHMAIYSNDLLDSTSQQRFYNGLKDPSYGVRKGNGIYRLYHPNGMLKTVAVYNGGQLHGRVQHYNSKQNVIATEHYSHDQLHGLSIRYHDNGQLKSEGQVQHGFKVGVWANYGAEQSLDTFALTEYVPYQGFEDTSDQSHFSLAHKRAIWRPIGSNIQFDKLDLLRQKGITGKVEISAEVNVVGELQDLIVAKSSGNDFYDQAVLEWVENLPYFLPAIEEQAPATERITIPFNLR